MELLILCVLAVVVIALGIALAPHLGLLLGGALLVAVILVGAAVLMGLAEVTHDTLRYQLFERHNPALRARIENTTRWGIIGVGVLLVVWTVASAVSMRLAQ